MTQYNYKITTKDGDQFKCEYISVGSGELWAENVWYNRDDEDILYEDLEEIVVVGTLVPDEEIEGFAEALAAGTEDSKHDRMEGAKQILQDEKRHIINKY